MVTTKKTNKEEVSRSSLKFYKKDPNNKKRGYGFYYNRTWKDNGYSTKYMSKYDSKRDYYRLGEHKVGGSRRFAHFTDNPKKAGAEVSVHRKDLSSDGKYYDTQKRKVHKKDVKKYSNAKDVKKTPTKPKQKYSKSQEKIGSRVINQNYKKTPSKPKPRYSKDPTTAYFQRKVGINRYNQGVKESNRDRKNRYK